MEELRGSDEEIDEFIVLAIESVNDRFRFIDEHETIINSMLLDPRGKLNALQSNEIKEEAKARLKHRILQDFPEFSQVGEEQTRHSQRSGDY